MAKGINKVIIVGNLGNDPETRTFPDGGSVTNVSIATTESWKDKQTGQQQERTEWHRVVFRGRLAEIAAQYLKKGSKVYIEGSLRTSKYQDKQTGQDRYSTDVVAREMQMLDSRADGQAPAQQAAPQQYQQPQAPQQNAALQKYQQAPAPQQAPPPAPGEFDSLDEDIPFSNYQLKVIV